MRVPKVLTGLGTVKELVIMDNDDQLVRYKFDAKSKWLLTSNSTGTALILFPWQAKLDLAASEGELERQIDRAAKLYEKWSDFETDSASAHNVSEAKMKTSGRAYSITYKSDKWSGKQTAYIHHFEADTVKVKMDSKSDPQIIQIFGGKMKVKPEGIVG